MIKIGHSKDVHKLGTGRSLILGGIPIPYEKGLIGHSDADVLLHAICEALIGAMGMGDIGTLFPDTDDKYKDIDSSVLLKDVYQRLNLEGYQINNIDATVYAEMPKLNPYIEKIRTNIARILEMDAKLVNVKATRGEGMGYIGRGEGIGAEAVCLLTTK